MTSRELQQLFDRLDKIDELLHKVMRDIDEKYVEVLRAELNYKKNEKP